MSTILIDVNPHQANPQMEPLRALEPSASLRMLVMGDFSGKATGKLVRVDRDNFESILNSLAPHVEVALGNGQLGDADLVFRSLSDFEPDSIYKKSELFAPLRDETGHVLYSEPDESETRAQLKPTAEQIARLTSPGGLLDAIVEKTSTTRSEGSGGSAAPAPKKTDEFESMVQRIVAPYATPAESEESKRAAAERGQRLSLLMAHILHDPAFQAMEAAWRGLDMLVHGLDTDDQIHLFLLDISKEKLAAELKAAADVEDTSLYRGLTGRWGLLLGNFSFDREVLADVETFERVCSLAHSLEAPFVAEWLTSSEESAEAEEAWKALRRSAAAHYGALALPRFLLRLPYGKATVPVEEFEFEEMTGEPVHNEYLWGNPAFACGLVLGRLFEQEGKISPAPAFLRLSDLPLHVFEVDGEQRVRPCTEVPLSDKDLEALLDEGVLPLAAVKGSDSIVFPRMRSIALGAGVLGR